MGRPPPRVRKYGMPVYAAAWPAGNVVYLAGGGGHGIQNRVVAVMVDGEQLSDDAVAELPLDDVPYRMVAHPGGNALIVALSGGRVVRVDISSPSAGNGGGLTLSLAAGEEAAALAKAHGDRVVCVAFSADGQLLALGGADGGLTVLDWPKLRVRAAIGGERRLKAELRDMDFSGAHQQRVLAVACEDGSCSLWDWEKATQLIQLELPSALRKGGAFNRVRFARDGSLRLFTAVNVAGRGHVLQWQQDEAGEVVLRMRESPVEGAITAFDISVNGSTLGLGTSEGEAVALSSATLKRLRRERQAHMVFATAAAVSADGMVLTGSADAGVCVTSVAKRQRSAARSLLVPLLVLLLAVLVAYVLQLRGRSARWPAAQEVAEEFKTSYDANL